MPSRQDPSGFETRTTGQLYLLWAGLIASCCSMTSRFFGPLLLLLVQGRIANTYMAGLLVALQCDLVTKWICPTVHSTWSNTLKGRVLGCNTNCRAMDFGGLGLNRRNKPSRIRAEEKSVSASYRSLRDGRFPATTWNAGCKATWMERLPLTRVAEMTFISKEMGRNLNRKVDCLKKFQRVSSCIQNVRWVPMLNPIGQ